MFFLFHYAYIQESVDRSEDHNYKEQMEVIGWFLFDLLLLGYVEDPITGLSFSIPGGMDWKIFVEVPSQIGSESPKQSLKQFFDEVPALGMLGVPYPINPNTPYTVDEDVQLVCKYLKAYWVFMEKGGQKGINKIYGETCKLDTPSLISFLLSACSSLRWKSCEVQ